MDRKFANNENEAKKLAAKVTFKDFHILSENVTLYDMKKANILLDKPSLTCLRIMTGFKKFIKTICISFIRILIVFNY